MLNWLAIYIPDYVCQYEGCFDQRFLVYRCWTSPSPADVRLQEIQTDFELELPLLRGQIAIFIILSGGFWMVSRLLLQFSSSVISVARDH